MKISITKSRLYLMANSSLKITRNTSYIDVLIFDKENIIEFHKLCDRPILYMEYDGKYIGHFGRSYANRRILNNGMQDKLDKVYIVPAIPPMGSNLLDGEHTLILATNDELKRITRKSILKIFNNSETEINNKDVANSHHLATTIWKNRSKIQMSVISGTM